MMMRAFLNFSGNDEGMLGWC